MTRAALYARVSTRDQDPAMQLSELRQVAQQRGWTVVDEYVDHGVSGRKDRRPELDRMLADVGLGKIDVVAVWKFDRFARSLKHLMLTLDDLRAKNVDFVSIRNQLDTSTPTGRLLFQIVGAVAEFEVELIRERVLAGLDEARRKGKTLGRRRRYLDEDRARELLDSGHSLAAVANELGVGKATLVRRLGPKTRSKSADAIGGNPGT